MITRLKVDGYKSLRGVELTDLGGVNVFWGANASGKSNLLDALDLLGHLARAESVLQAFQRHRGSRGERPLPVRRYFALSATTAHDLRFEVDLELPEARVTAVNDELEAREKQDRVRAYTRLSRRRLRYTLVVHHDETERSLVVTDESLVALRDDGQPLAADTVVPFITSKAGGLSVKLERQSHPRSFALPRQRTVLSEVGDLVNHPHLVAVARELASIRVYYLEPNRMRAEVADVQAHDPGSNGEHLASYYYWLSRAHPGRLRNVERNLRAVIPGFAGIEAREGENGFLELWVQEDGRGAFPASVLSEGTLRLLCLAGILASPDPPAVIGYEEPENGVHPGRLGQMLDLVETAGRRNNPQFFVTSHSPEVIDRLHGWPRFRVERHDLGSAYVPLQQLPLFSDSDVGLQGDGNAGPSVGERIARGDV